MINNFFTTKINNNIFIRYNYINNSKNCYLIWSNKKRYSNNSNTNNKDMIDKKIDFDMNFKKINFNKYITEQDQVLFLENEHYIYDFIIKVKNNLNINYITDLYSINKDQIKIRLRKRDLYIFKNIDDTIYSSKRINYIYFIYKKKINVIFGDVNYNIYCIYYLHDDYSFDDFSQIKYTCLYVCFDVNRKSFFFDNNTCDLIINIENNLPSHLKDIYLYNSLIYSVYNLSQNYIIEKPLEYRDSYWNIFLLLQKKKIIGYTSFWKKKNQWNIYNK